MKYVFNMIDGLLEIYKLKNTFLKASFHKWHVLRRKLENVFYEILSTIFENENCMVSCDNFGIIGWVPVLPDCHGLVGGLLARSSV